MRLDHLLSKENRVFLFCRLVGCLVRHLVVASFLSPHVGFACGGKFLFSGEDRYRTHFMCVWFWELMKQELFAVFQPLLVVKVFAE